MRQTADGMVHTTLEKVKRMQKQMRFVDNHVRFGQQSS